MYGISRYGPGMHDWILMEMELGKRVAHCQDSEDCGWSALLDLSYAQYCDQEQAMPYETEGLVLLPTVTDLPRSDAVR